MPSPKLPKYKVGDEVYIKKSSMVLFGKIESVRSVEDFGFRHKRHGTRKKIRYFVRFDEVFVDRRRRYRNQEIKGAWVAESSLHLITNEEEMVRAILGQDYI